MDPTDPLAISDQIRQDGARNGRSRAGKQNRLRGLSRVDKAEKIGRTGRVGRVRRVGGEKGRSATIKRGRTVWKKNSRGRGLQK